MRPIVRVFTQAPGHDTTEAQRLHNLFEFPRNQLGGIPGPEELGLGIPIILATSLFIGLAFSLGFAPRVNGRDTAAGAVVRQAPSRAELIG